MTRIVFFTLIFCFLISGSSVFAVEGYYKGDSEPDGFRDIKWGADIEKIKDMEQKGIDPSYGGLDVYTKKEDKLTIGGAQLTEIEYKFWKEKFLSVDINCEGTANCLALKQAAFEKFGKGFQSAYTEKYTWFGQKTFMIFEYSDTKGKGYLRITSKAMLDEVETYNKSKAKEGAEKGF